MERFFFIVNPISGFGRAKAEFDTVKQLLDARGADYEWTFSERPGHASELAANALAAGFTHIVAVGGDGTVNEVASALVGTHAVLGVLPFGTGNDLARVAGFSKDPEQAVETLFSGRVVPMDAGEANGMTFVNVAGLGFDVDVLVKTTQYKQKYPRGMLPYLLGILNTLGHLRALNMIIEHDGERIETAAIVLSVGNGQYIGGGMRAVPMADLFDGYLDCVYVDKLSVLTFLTMLPRFLKGKHLNHPAVHHFRTREVKVSVQEQCVINYDGELKSHSPVVFRVLPGALRVLVPAGEAQ